MANEPPVPSMRYPCHPTNIAQSAEVPPLTGGLESSEHPPGPDLNAPYTSMNLINYDPPVTYNGNMGYDDACRQAIDHAEHRGNQGHSGTHLAPGFIQHNPVIAGPPRLEYYAPVAPRVPNDVPLNGGPHPRYVAMPAPGNPSRASSVPSVMLPSRDLKDLANHYLQNPGSQVETFRMRRRSGGFKLLILLDIEDTTM